MISQSSETTRALVVGDDPQETSLVTEVLEMHNYDCLVATNGDEALQVAASFAPAIVIMSVSIPGQDGWLVCCKLKSSKQPPKVMLIATLVTDRDRQFADFVHADRLIRKPFSRTELDSVLDEMSHG